jgi:hypothetical protein
MGFLTPALLAGGVLVAVPLLLHLIMRRQPQQHTFPALRFVQQRRESNQRRMRLRHLLLLALRCALIGGLAFALARPTLRGSGLRGKKGAPLAVALVFDNSLRMQYVHQQRSRLQQASDMAAWLVNKLPIETSVVVLDRGRRVRGHLADVSAAESRLQRLPFTSHPRPLGDTVQAALELVGACQECRQEVFLFTDMTRASLTDTAFEQIAAAMEEAPDARMYLIDVGIDKPHNVALGNLRMRHEILTPGESLRMEFDLQATDAVKATMTPSTGPNQTESDQTGSDQTGSDQTGPGEASASQVARMADSQTLVELYLNNDQGEPIKRGQQWYDWNGQDKMAANKIAFELAELPLGTHQGSVRLATADPLLIDNIRYFTALVHAPARILLAGETDRDTLFVRAALCPSVLGNSATGEDTSRTNGPMRPNSDKQAATPSPVLTDTRFHCKTVRFANLAQTELEPYAAVGLLDPPALPAEAWQNLADFAETGGGVGIFLGHRARPQAFNEGAAGASSLLPGKLRRRSRDVTYFHPQRFNQPALAELADYAADIPWSIYPVLQFWEFGELAAETQVIARFANNQPALLGRLASAGRVLTMATPFSDPREPVGRETWNLLPTGPEPWPFVMLTGGLFSYLAQESTDHTMFQAGEAIRIPLASRQQVSSFVLQQPDGQALRQTLPPGQDAIGISTAEALGNYRLAAGGKSRTLDRGFSINAAASSSLLARVDPTQVTAVLPPERVHLARTLDDIQQDVDIGRTGRELFPWIILLVVLVWGAEHLLANRFYLGSS